MNKQTWIKLAAKVLSLLLQLACDGLLLAGLALFVYGLSLAWRPLGFIAGGLVLSAAAFFTGYRRIVRPPQS